MVVEGSGIIDELGFIQNISELFHHGCKGFNSDADIERFITSRVTESMILLTLAVIVVAIWRRRAGLGEVARDAANTLFVVGAALMAQILIFYVAWNVVFDWYLPNMRFGFKYYLDVFQTTAFWPMLYVPVAAILAPTWH